MQKYLSYHASYMEAWAALEKYVSDKVVGVTLPPAESVSIKLEEVYAFWSARKFPTVGQSAVYSYQASWRCRVSRYAKKSIRSIGIDQWQSIIDEDAANGLSKSSIDNDVTLIHALCSYAMERDWIDKDYSQFIRLPSVPPKRLRGVLTEEEINAIEAMAREDVQGADAALVLCYTGWRITEFLQLTPGSYNSREHTLIGGIKTEAGKNRVVPVHPRIQHYIDRYVSQGGAYLYMWDGAHSPQCFRQKLFAPVMQRLNRPEVTPHWCRHTFASMLHQVGANELNIKRLMGHSDKDITEHYTHVSLEELRKTILLLP